MKLHSTRASGSPGFRALFALAFFLVHLSSGVFAGLVVSPNAIDTGYVGPCDLSIDGLTSPGQSVLVEEYLDTDGSTTITASDVLVRQFVLTDGQVTSIGGQRNVNVPGDEDVTVNSQIQMRVVLRGQADLTQVNGLHLFRVSPVGGGFTPFTATLTVTQKDHGGSGISGTTGQAGAFVVFLAGGFDGEFAGVTACDGSGAYSMKLPPGSYLPMAAKPGYVYNAGGASSVTVSSGAFTTGQNLSLVAGTRTISGKVRDANTPSIGVPALFMHAVSSSGIVSLTYTDGNGDYQVDAPAEGCELGFDEWQVATHGYMPTDVIEGSAGSVTGFNIDLTPVPAMIYGSLKTPANVALPYQSVDAMQFGGSNSSQTMTDTNGNFSLGVTTGSWELHSEPLGHVVQFRTVVVNTPGSAVLQNLVATPVTAHLIGQVRDSSNTPVPNLEIIARDPTQMPGNEINAFATTDASGNFDLGVYGGGGTTTKLWTLQVLFTGGGPPAYISTSPVFNVQDGVNITGIIYQVYNVTAHLRGQVLDETDTPVGNISAYATHTTLNGVNTGSNVDGTGSFDLSVFAGTWNLGLSNISGLGLIPQNLQATVSNGVDQNGLVIRALHTTATISGTVKDASNQAVGGIHVYGTVLHGGQTYNTSGVTDGSGAYSLPVFSETWTISLDSTDLAGQGFQPASNQNVFANTGNVTQNFVVQSSGGMAPEIALEQPAGTGLVDGGSKSFGTLPVGGSVNLVFTIKNTGTTDLTGLQVTKDGSNAADFTVDTSGMTASVAASSSTTFSVTFAPVGSSTGLRSAAIHIANNDADENPFDLQLSGIVSAAASLDPGFGTAGATTTPIGSGNDYGRGVVVQPDGKIILAGHGNTGPGDDFAVVRYNANGALDSSFGTGGKVTTPFAGSLDWGRSVALQSDGKIVVAGHSGSGSNSDDFAVARYLPNGTLDTTFSGDGVITVDLSSGAGDDGMAVVIQPDGKIVVAGTYATGSAAALVRFNGNGTLDTSFSGDGIVVTSFGAQEVFQAVALQPDGKIVAAGYVLTSSGLPLVARYMPDGTLDSSFGTGGRTITNTGGNSPVYALQVQPDGKVVLGGAKSGDFLALRYDTNGVLDTTFGGTGYVTTNLGGSDGASGLALQANGRVVLVGSSNAGGNHDFAVVRYNLDGSLDTTFNGTGSIRTPVGSSDDLGACVALGGDGTIVVGGYSINGGNYDFALVRYLGDPIYPDIVVEQPATTNLVDGSAVVSLGGINISGSVSKTFTLRNVGDGVLSGLAISFDGANSGDFSAPSLGSTTLAAGASMTFAVTFAPTGGGSGGRTAALHVGSNDPDESPFDVDLSALALSTATDTDSDGLNDWAEYQYGALGFDWQINQAALVNTLNSGANAAGLFTPSQVQALNVGTPLLQRNPATGVFTLTIGVHKSTDLIHFSPFPITAPQTTINGSGQMEFQFTLPDNAAFLRLNSQ